MNQQTTPTAHVHEDMIALEQCRTAFIVQIASQFLGMLLSYDKLPPNMNRNVLKQSKDQVERCVREIRRTVSPHHASYLDRNLKEGKTMDIASMVSIVARIGAEENQDEYEEFFSLMVDCFDAVLYAQNNRKKMHFGKYKALFKMLEAEIKADVNGISGQVLWNNRTKELYLRSVPPVIEHKMN